MKEEISALMDDELDEDACHRLVSRMASQQESQQHWHLYHLIGEAIREKDDFRANISFDISEALAKEPTLLAPVSRPKKAKIIALSLAASLAAVAMVGWVAMQDQAASPAAAQAQANVQAQNLEASSDYLQAHREVAERPEMLSGIRTVADSPEESGR